MFLFGALLKPSFETEFVKQSLWELYEQLQSVIKPPLQIEGQIFDLNKAWPLTQGFVNKGCNTGSECNNPNCVVITIPKRERKGIDRLGSLFLQLLACYQILVTRLEHIFGRAATISKESMTATYHTKHFAITTVRLGTINSGLIIGEISSNRSTAVAKTATKLNCLPLLNTLCFGLIRLIPVNSFASHAGIRLIQRGLDGLDIRIRGPFVGTLTVVLVQVTGPLQAKQSKTL